MRRSGTSTADPAPRDRVPSLCGVARSAIIPRMNARTGLGPLALAMVLAACTAEGKEVATTFHDPTANPSGTPPTTSEGDEETAGSTEDPAGSSGAADSGDTSMPGSESGGSSGGMPVDEQPEDGMYSACMGPGDCIGLTTCVLVGATGFCSNANCANPVADCLPNPSLTSTAPALCVAEATGLMVCALSCADGQTCPGGMDCLPLGTTMVCA
jgi:hypothetical protein